MSVVRFIRDPDVDEEIFDGDVLLMQRRHRVVAALSPAAAVLWEALRWPHSEADLVQLVSEARPVFSVDDVRFEVLSALETLVEQGFVGPYSPED